MRRKKQYLDIAVDDLWCHAKGKPCHRSLSEVAKELIGFLNDRVTSEWDGKKKTHLFQFYVDDLSGDIANG